MGLFTTSWSTLEVDSNLWTGSRRFYIMGAMGATFTIAPLS